MNTEQTKFVNSLRSSDENGVLKSFSDEQILAITWLSLVMCRGELVNLGFVDPKKVFKDEFSETSGE